MGHSRTEKAASRERILAEASTQARRQGLESLSVGKLMQKVGLTHGGFYGHFASRGALLAAALERALADGEGDAHRAAGRGDRPPGLAGFVRGYLSRAHRDAPERGCAIAALVCDAGRADDGARAVMEAHVERMFETVGAGLGDPDGEAGVAAVCAMVGALAISRTITDPKRSDALLRIVRDHVIGLQPAE